MAVWSSCRCRCVYRNDKVLVQCDMVMIYVECRVVHGGVEEGVDEEELGGNDVGTTDGGVGLCSTPVATYTYTVVN